MKPMHLLINVIFYLSLVVNVLGIYNPFPSIKRYSYCQFAECCNEDYIKGNTKELELLLKKKLYGQHLARRVVVDALTAHFQDKHPQKALTLSFHGWPGSGKNYVTRFIKQTLYAKGSASKFIHEFTARIHFPLKSKITEYQANLQEWIKGNVTNCERSLFIFDEVDKMPETVLDAIKPFIDHYDSVEGVDFRKSIFIFLSNTGGTIIKDHLLTLWEGGVKRDEIQLSDFENLILKGAFNEEGGFRHCDNIKSNLIDHYIPFLPMEKEHVELCIKDQFELRNIDNPPKYAVKEVMDFVEWGPEPINLFSTTGCKRLSQKVPLVIATHKLRPREEL